MPPTSGAAPVKGQEFQARFGKRSIVLKLRPVLRGRDEMHAIFTLRPHAFAASDGGVNR